VSYNEGVLLVGTSHMYEMCMSTIAPHIRRCENEIWMDYTEAKNKWTGSEEEKTWGCDWWSDSAQHGKWNTQVL